MSNLNVFGENLFTLNSRDNLTLEYYLSFRARVDLGALVTGLNKKLFFYDLFKNNGKRTGSHHPNGFIVVPIEFVSKEILQPIPNQKLVVVGNGKNYKKKCLKYIQVNNLEKNILFINNLSLNEIRAIYAKAEIMIYPSIFEGFGIPILEALFSKVPVITSKDGCFSEAGGPHTSYINPFIHLTNFP